MRFAGISVMGVGLFVAALAFPGCVGDDPTGATTTGNDAGTTTPPTPPPPPGDTDAGGTDAGSCTGFADCDNNPANGCETAITTPQNCGACGHACGGSATCNAGVCTAETIATGLDHPFGLRIAGNRALWLHPDAVMGCTTGVCSTTTAILVDVTPSQFNPTPKNALPAQIHVDGASFYYVKCPNGSNSDCMPAQCALTGCKNLGSTYVGTPNGSRHAQTLFGNTDAMYTWTGIDRLQKYTLPPPSAMPAPPSLYIGDYFGGGYVDGKSFVYLDDNKSAANPTGGIYVCPKAGCASQPPSLVPPPVKGLAVANDVAFTSTAQTPGAAAILSCAIGGCGGAGDVLAQNQAYVSAIAADAKDVVWATVGAADPTTNLAAGGTIMRCSLPACAGGPVVVADKVVNPVGVQIDDNYIYWITYGTGANKDGTLARRRR